MDKLSSRTILAAQEIDFLTDVEIRSSWDKLTDTAKITFPRGVRFIGSDYVNAVDALFKKGDNAELYFGYNGDNKVRFRGRIASIKPGNRLEFMLEDDLYLCKIEEVESYSKESVTLNQLLTDICPIPFTAIDVDLGQFRIKNSNVAEVLEMLRKTYGLYSWVDETGELKAGFAYNLGNPTTHVFEVGKNVISSEGLTYYREDDIKLRIKAISMQPDNKKIEVSVGDEKGELRTVFKYNVSEAELRRFAEAQLEEMKFEGYRGSFRAFTSPVVRHGDIVSFRDPFIPERNGDYFVREVTTKFGFQADEQIIKLDRKA